MAELMSLKTTKAWPLIRMFFLATIYLGKSLHPKSSRTPRAFRKGRP